MSMLKNCTSRLTDVEMQLLTGKQPVDAPLASELESAGWQDDASLRSQATIVLGALYSLSSPAKAREYLLAVERPGEVQRALRLLQAIANEPALDRSARGRLQELQLALLQAAADRDRESGTGLHYRWQRQQADLLVDAERFEQAIVVLEGLEQAFPKNASIKVQLASALTAAVESRSERPLPASVTGPVLARWRIIAARTRSHTPPWFEAKYQTARLLQLSGDRDGARKLLEYLKAIPPGWAGADREADFESLLNAVRDSN